MEPKTILSVEDDPEFQQILREILEAAGYRVLSAPDGEAGLKTAKAEKPDMILLDIEMPIMDGYQVCEAVRADEEIKHIPIILITIQAKVHQVVKGLKLGANDHVTKPFDPDDVLTRVTGVFKQIQK